MVIHAGESSFTLVAARGTISQMLCARKTDQDEHLENAVREKSLKGTYIDHDSLVSLLPQRSDGTNRAPVELDGRTDTVHTRAEYHDAPIGEADVVLGAVVCQVEVVCDGRELSSHSVNLLDNWGDASIDTNAAHRKFIGIPELGKLTVGIPQLLCPPQQRQCDARSVIT